MINGNGSLSVAVTLNFKDVSQHQENWIFYCSDYQLQQLIDVRPEEGSSYIRSLTEPFDEEMDLKEERVKRWLEHFKLIKSEKDWNHSHVSGHGDGTQMKNVIDGAKPKRLVPVHTEHEEYHRKLHNNVVEVAINDTLEL